MGLFSKKNLIKIITIGFLIAILVLISGKKYTQPIQQISEKIAKTTKKTVTKIQDDIYNSNLSEDTINAIGISQTNEYGGN